MCIWSFPGGIAVKNPLANAGEAGDMGSVPELGRSPGVGTELRKWQPVPAFLPGSLMEEEPGGLQSIGLQRVKHNWVKHTHEVSALVVSTVLCCLLF